MQLLNIWLAHRMCNVCVAAVPAPNRDTTHHTPKAAWETCLGSV